MSDLEHRRCDYPFYNDEPASTTWIDWIIVLLALALGFATLEFFSTSAWLGSKTDTVLRAFLFCAIPLAAFVWRFRPHSTEIFRGWRWSYLGWGVVIGILNLLFTFVIGMLAIKRMGLASNGMAKTLEGGGIPDGPAIFYLSTGIQLFGEEVITILPFLFLLWLGVQKIGMSRSVAIFFAWLGSALIFGALHLPTYGWTFIQALLLIGPVRLVLTLAYLKTKSIWASTIAHIVNDWAMFTFVIIASALPK